MIHYIIKLLQQLQIKIKRAYKNVYTNLNDFSSNYEKKALFRPEFV
jgi:hypothetical protein